MSPNDPRPGQAQLEPAFGRDESVDRMKFLLSLRRRGISDVAVLRAMDAVPREALVLPSFAATAYADRAMPIACGQTSASPTVSLYTFTQDVSEIVGERMKLKPNRIGRERPA